jgi:hypothetical protein
MQNRRYFVLAVLFAVIMASALLVVALRPLIPALANILMFLVGLFAMASLSAFHRLLESAEGRPLVQITFNEGLATSQLETAAKRAGIEVVDAEVVSARREPGDLPPEDFLGQDNSLALAKVRMDIERELRRLAASAGLGETVGRLSLRRVADELAKRQLIDPGVLGVIDDILPAANQAIHGKEVSTDTAAAIVRLGRQLISLLQATENKRWNP